MIWFALYLTIGIILGVYEAGYKFQSYDIPDAAVVVTWAVVWPLGVAFAGALYIYDKLVFRKRIT